MNTLLKKLFIPIMFLGLVACGNEVVEEETSQPETGNIVEVATEAGSFTTLIAALEATGLDATLADENGTFTVFAPSDDAFAKLGQETIDGLLADPDALREILLYHVVGEEIAAEAAIAVANSESNAVVTANSTSDVVVVTVVNDTVFVNNSEVTATDINASNGIIHVIDTVLLPPAEVPQLGNIVDVATGAGSFTTLIAALEATGLDDVLADESGSFTVFAPTDAAFAELGEETISALLADTDALTEILLYHVIVGSEIAAEAALAVAASDDNTVAMSNTAADVTTLTIVDGNLFINESQVIATDVAASNGVIHVINKVLLPPAPPVEEPELGNIAEVAAEAGGFTTLIAALEATGLDDVLADENGSFTVFAPNDDAFAKLGEDTINALLADTDALTEILLYHVIVGSEIAAEAALAVAASDDNAIQMSNADADLATLKIIDGKLFINNSEVIATDVAANNGVIHVIDTVLLPPEAPLVNIAETAAAAGSFTTLLAALEVADLASALSDETRSFTVFAPTDDAFAKLGQETIDTLLADPEALANILLYHVIEGPAIDAATAISLDGQSAEMLNGDNVNISVTNGQLFINASQVILADVLASNGIIHAIDTVLLPPEEPEEPALVNIVETATAAGSFNTLIAALEATGLNNALSDEDGNFTVFAPNDEAFAKLGQHTIDALLADPEALADILLYHVISDSRVNAETAINLDGESVTMTNGDDITLTVTAGELFVNQSKVIATDIAATNGIIHVIDTVLLPPVDEPEEPVLVNIVETATAAGSFNTLIAALEATGLNNALSNEDGSFTVFAPTDDAFAKLGEETINALLADPETLADILLYHVISDSEVDAATALSLDGQDVTMTNEDTVRLSVADGKLFVNMSEVIATDINASNGIIHVIDTVLIPPKDVEPETPNIIETAQAAGTFNTLLAALEATGLDEVLAADDGKFTVFAPNDAAFDKLGGDTITNLLNDIPTLTNILLYHVLVGSEVDATTAISLAGERVMTGSTDDIALSLTGDHLFVNTSKVIATDIVTSNGIIHVLDTVLLPPAEAPSHPGNIIETAKADGRFTTLLTALEATRLDRILERGFQFTVFAPTDDAFAKLPEGLVENLLEHDLFTLNRILLKHVVANVATADHLAIDALTAYTLNGESVRTLSGETVEISIEDNELRVDDISVIITDIITSNGIIHVIDEVILLDDDH